MDFFDFLHIFLGESPTNDTSPLGRELGKRLPGSQED